MTLLQPTEVPSREGINNAITSEIADHASTTDINSLHYDSGWVGLVRRAGYVSAGEANFYRRIGNVVYLRGRIARENGTVFAANSTQLVADLPVDFRPLGIVMFGLAGSDAANSGGRFWIDASGTIVFNPKANPLNISIGCSFPVL